LNRLEQAGLVERVQDIEDARVLRVFLTPQGWALEAPVKKIWQELETLTVYGLSVAEKDQLRRLLGRINDNLAG
jgi:DNA-binding MarR family transcriptional regulator